MQSKLYAVTFKAVTVSAAQDFFELTPADDRPVELACIGLSQYSDTGDAAEELLRYSIQRGHTTGGSGGTAPTPRPMAGATGTAGAAAEVNNTTIASAGTAHELWADTFNIRTGLPPLWFPAQHRPGADQGDVTIVVRLEAAPADPLSMNGTLLFWEYES